MPPWTSWRSRRRTWTWATSGLAFTALFDACVLYPAPLRDLLLNLACTGLFRARWSAQIHDEWIRNLSKARPELADKLQRTRDAMDRAVPDCLVTDYEGLIDCVTSPDAMTGTSSRRPSSAVRTSS